MSRNKLYTYKVRDSQNNVDSKIADISRVVRGQLVFLQSLTLSASTSRW
jgi:hypothetical protein